MLEALGLSPAESRVYTELIETPRATAPELARRAELSTRRCAGILADFVRRGLVSRLPGKRARYVAVAPDLAVRPLLSRREDELNRVRTIIAELATAYQRSERHTHPAELVEVVTGQANILSRAFALQESAQRSLRVIVKPPYVMGGTTPNAEREHKRLREGIEYRVLYDREAVKVPGKVADILESGRQGEQARVAASAPMKLWLVDDAAALIPIRGASHTIDAAFVTYPSALLDALIALFELEWERAVPVRSFDLDGGFAGPPAPDQPDATARRLLALLAAGLTDEGIARAMGMSLRTLQRRLHGLMQDLDASTRFQAGMAARDRGWV